MVIDTPNSHVVTVGVNLTAVTVGVGETYHAKGERSGARVCVRTRDSRVAARAMGRQRVLARECIRSVLSANEALDRELSPGEEFLCPDR